MSAATGQPTQSAAALAVVQTLRGSKTEAELGGVCVQELQPQFVRAALRAIEGNLSPDGSNVMSLVPPPSTDAPAPDADPEPPAAA